MIIHDKIKMRAAGNPYGTHWRGTNLERGLLNDKQFLMGESYQARERNEAKIEAERKRIEDNTITHVKHFSKFVKFRHKQTKYKILNKRIQENSYLGRATIINEDAILKFREYWEEIK